MYSPLTPNKDLFEDLNQEDGGSVLLGNNKCKILEIGSVRIKMFDGMEKLLQELRFVHSKGS